MSEELNGDKDFQDFLEKNPPSDQLSPIINALNLKSQSIFKAYSKSIDIYKELNKDDPLKKELKIFINKLMEHLLHTISQFDYALIDEGEGSEMENGEDEDGEQN